MRRIFPALMIAVALSALSAPVVGQEMQVDVEQRHNGWWFGAGLGGGWNSTDTPDTTQGGGAGFIRGGGTLKQWFLFGVDVAFWVKRIGTSQDPVWISSTNATAMAMLYPLYPLGGYLKVGVGVGIADVVENTEVLGAIPPAHKEYGIGLTGGIGWDLRVGRNFYLTPNVDVIWNNVQNPVGTEKVNSLAVTIALGVTWH